MRDYYYEMGQRIAALRKEHHITQESFAEIMDVSVKHISQIERGIASFSLEKLISVSDYFNCSMDFLVHGTRTDDIALSFPPIMIEIIKSDNESEKALLRAYLDMYRRLRDHATTLEEHDPSSIEKRA